MTRPVQSGLLRSGLLRHLLALLPFVLFSSAARTRRHSGAPHE
jgi:hypothetical protein